MFYLPVDGVLCSKFDPSASGAVYCGSAISTDMTETFLYFPGYAFLFILFQH